MAFAEEDDEQLIEEIVVTGIRGSLRQALDMKRDADNVMDALVAEDIGKFPDQNLAESLQRVSGVAIDRMRGEGAQVSIRGLGPQFTRVLVNGRGALSGGTQAFAGGVGDHSQQRTYRFESMQAELVQAVEVYKSAQANVLEGGMGGTLNIRTRRPFDNGGRRILAGNAFVTDDDLAEDNGYRFAGVYSDSFADNTLGFLVSVAGDDRVTREDWFAVADSEPKVFNNAINLATGELLRGCDLPGVANPRRRLRLRAGQPPPGHPHRGRPAHQRQRRAAVAPERAVGRHRRHPVFADGPRLRRLADSVALPGGARERRERGAAQREPDRDVHPHGEGAATTEKSSPFRRQYDRPVRREREVHADGELDAQLRRLALVRGTASRPTTRATTTSRPCP